LTFSSSFFFLFLLLKMKCKWTWDETVWELSYFIFYIFYYCEMRIWVVQNSFKIDWFFFFYYFKDELKEVVLRQFQFLFMYFSFIILFIFILFFIFLLLFYLLCFFCFVNCYYFFMFYKKMDKFESLFICFIIYYFLIKI